MAATGNQAEAARVVGVNRSTVKRWMEDPEFVALLEADPEAVAVRGLGELVPEALKLLEEAMSPSGKVTAAKAQVALSIIKMASQLHIDTGGTAVTLADALSELDAETRIGSD